MKRLFQFIEKRINPRRPVRLPATFMIVRGEALAMVTGWHKGTIINQSDCGCCLVIDKLSIEGFYIMKCLDDIENYRVNLKLEENAVEKLGKICWVDRYEEGLVMGFKIGIEFTDAPSSGP